MIGHTATPGGVLDRAIDAEDAKHHDFLRLDHVEGYHELSSKTRLYFSTAVSMWDADFYVKVDDDVHLNLGQLNFNPNPPTPSPAIVPFIFFFFSLFPGLTLGRLTSRDTGTLVSTLGTYRSKPRIYIGCMKSGPVLSLE